MLISKFLFKKINVSSFGSMSLQILIYSTRLGLHSGSNKRTILNINLNVVRGVKQNSTKTYTFFQHYYFIYFLIKFIKSDKLL